MRGRALLRMLSVAILFVLPAFAFAEEDPEAMIRNMRPAWKKVTDISAEMTKRELFGSSLSPEERIVIKFSKPFNVYLKYLTKPYKGREAIFKGKDWNKGEIMATNGSFPNVTVNLNPYGSLAMKGQHHPITHISFDYSIKNTISQMDLAKKNGELSIKSLGTSTIDGRSCTRIELGFNAKAGQEVTPEKGDSWNKLGSRYSNDPYVIEHHNPKKKPDDTSAKIWIPTYYSSKLEVCLDDATNLPISSKAWDHNGKLYEEYVYYKFKVNVGFTALDFDPENSSYGF